MSPDIIKFTGLALNVLGSLVLAFRVTNILRALSLVAKCHEENISQLTANQRVVVQFVNSTKHVERAQKTTLLIAGFVLMILGLLCQGLSMLLVAK